MTTSSTSPLPQTMKAVVRTGWTGFGLDFVADAPTPFLTSSTSNQVLIKVHAAALNPVDYKMPRLILGSVYGLDVCGTVVATSEDTSLKVGDVVVGPVAMGYSGSLAEYALAYANKCAKLPKGWTPVQSAALPIAAGTALEGFRQAGILQTYLQNQEKPPIDTLLVIGASGGCGLLALQLAKGMGISRIVGICSQKNAALCQDNGATEIVPYDDPKAMDRFLHDNAGQVDVIYDAASYSGGTQEGYCDDPQIWALLKDECDNSSTTTTTTTRSPYIMLNGSNYHKVKAVACNKLLGKTTQQHLIVLPRFSGEDLALSMELLNQAGLKPVVDATHEFTKEGVEQGYQLLKSRRAKGKIVYQISEI